MIQANYSHGEDKNRNDVHIRQNNGIVTQKNAYTNKRFQQRRLKITAIL